MAPPRSFPLLPVAQNPDIDDRRSWFGNLIGSTTSKIEDLGRTAQQNWAILNHRDPFAPPPNALPVVFNPGHDAASFAGSVQTPLLKPTFANQTALPIVRAK